VCDIPACGPVFGAGSNYVALVSADAALAARVYVCATGADHEAKCILWRHSKAGGPAHSTAQHSSSPMTYLTSASGSCAEPAYLQVLHTAFVRYFRPCPSSWCVTPQHAACNDTGAHLAVNTCRTSSTLGCAPSSTNTYLRISHLNTQPYFDSLTAPSGQGLPRRALLLQGLPAPAAGG
jgi:hypothetical protein